MRRWSCLSLGWRRTTGWRATVSKGDFFEAPIKYARAPLSGAMAGAIENIVRRGATCTATKLSHNTGGCTPACITWTATSLLDNAHLPVTMPPSDRAGIFCPTPQKVDFGDENARSCGARACLTKQPFFATAPFFKKTHVRTALRGLVLTARRVRDITSASSWPMNQWLDGLDNNHHGGSHD
jgi:hypothetical protein